MRTANFTLTIVGGSISGGDRAGQLRRLELPEFIDSVLLSLSQEAQVFGPIHSALIIPLIRGEEGSAVAPLAIRYNLARNAPPAASSRWLRSDGGPEERPMGFKPTASCMASPTAGRIDRPLAATQRASTLRRVDSGVDLELSFPQEHAGLQVIFRGSARTP